MLPKLDSFWRIVRTHITQPLHSACTSNGSTEHWLETFRAHNNVQLGGAGWHYIVP